jgi:DNA-binding Lrp family transcriptional regulator
MIDKILPILQQDARLSDAEIAERIGSTAQAVHAAIDAAWQAGKIRGYRVIATDEAARRDDVWSVVEVGLTPERERGFDRIAERIARFREVVSCRLVSGSYDLLVEVRGHSLHEVAAFVSERLSTLEGVRSTRTHFMLKRYKEDGVLLFGEEKVERLPVTP